MKRNFPLLFIFLLILVMPVSSDQTVPEEPADQQFIPAVADLERVYGVDYSREVFYRIQMNSFRDYIIKLTENGPRPVGIPTNLGADNIAAREWIISELTTISNGRIEIEVLGDYASVLGKLPGYLPVNAPALMVGGHYDSVASASGANDDGTGVAAALEIAKVMSMYEWPLDIYFGFWNAEEIGLIGSNEVAQIMKDREVELLAYYNVDMLLVPDPGAPPGAQVLMAYPLGDYHLGQYWAELTTMTSCNYGQNTILPVLSSDFSGWQASDHWPFVQKGYTALFAHESGFLYDVAYHTAQDTWANPLYNYQIAADAVRSIGSAMAFTMARAYSEPTTHDLSFTLIPSHSRNFSVAISASTTINVTSRWWGGGTVFSLYDSNDQLIDQMVAFDASPWEQTAVFNHFVTTKGLYRLNVINLGGTSVGHEVTISYETDIDGNDVLDSQEFWFDSEYFNMDQDADSISDGREMILGTNLNSNDSDSDSMSDPWELEYGLDPLNPSDASEDLDNDGVTNAVEYAYDCNPSLPDSDMDSMPDLWEIENGLNPTLNDSLEDPDHDAVTNIQEYEDGTDPNYAEFRPERLVVPAILIGSGIIAILAVGLIVRRRT
ncbi:MAG: M28 family metallopeptidase [Candidatus Thorarchaeota archaeon]